MLCGYTFAIYISPSILCAVVCVDVRSIRFVSKLFFFENIFAVHGQRQIFSMSCTHFME